MDRYSRMVAFLKVVLPLAALSLLATLFLLSRSVTEDAVIPFAENEIAERLRDQQITDPFFSGTTPQGDEIMVSATVARPGDANTPASAEMLSGQLKLNEGAHINMTANGGALDLSGQSATFSGNVVIQSTHGYTLRTETFITALDEIDALAPDRVEGDSPMGTLTAGRMRIVSENDESDARMRFNNGVKLIYDPRNWER